MHKYNVYYLDFTKNSDEEFRCYWRSDLTDKEAVINEIESKNEWKVIFIECLS
jgi:hypothetical protein